MLILSDWGLFVRKSKTQLQSDGASPSVYSLFTSVRDDGVEERGEIQEQQPHIGVLLLQVCDG